MKKQVCMIMVLALFAFSGMAMASDGASLYASKCQLCHGANGAGGMMGPVLAGSDIIKGDEAPIKKVISDGIANADKKYPNFPMGMPKVALSEAELDAVVTYLKGL